VKIPITKDCPNCDGTGCIPVFGKGKLMVKLEMCPECRGKGRVPTGSYVEGVKQWEADHENQPN